MKLIGSLILALFLTGVAQGQTCTGNFGDAVVNLNFGNGSNPGPISYGRIIKANHKAFEGT